MSDHSEKRGHDQSQHCPQCEALATERDALRSLVADIRATDHSNYYWPEGLTERVDAVV